MAGNSPQAYPVYGIGLLTDILPLFELWIILSGDRGSRPEDREPQGSLSRGQVSFYIEQVGCEKLPTLDTHLRQLLSF